MSRFLKAELILNVLEHLPTAADVKDALNSLPPTYDGCYEFTLKQIEMKDPIQRDLAFKVLAWLSHTLGVLTVKALQEALAMETGGENLSEEKLVPVDNLIAACSGLVVTDTIEGTQHIRLLHETARIYLKNIRFGSLSPGPEIILNACLAYLSLPEFSELCFFKMRVDERVKKHAFYEYAASYWFGHAVKGNLESTSRDLIVNFLESSQRYSADEFLSSICPSAWGCDKGTPWTDWTKHSINRRDTPLHAAATYGLRTTVRFLIKKKGYETDRRNNFGETALHRASQVDKTGTMEELIAHGADLGAKVPHHFLTDTTPLMLAAICLQAEAVRVLLNHGVDVNTFDPKYRTCSLHLAASMDTKLTRLLLDRGAFVDFPGKAPHFPETWPMTSLHFAVYNAHAYQGALDRVSYSLNGVRRSMHNLVLVTLHYIWLSLPDVKIWRSFYCRKVQILAFKTKKANLFSKLHEKEVFRIGLRKDAQRIFSEPFQPALLYTRLSGPKTIPTFVSYWKRDMTLPKKTKTKLHLGNIVSGAPTSRLQRHWLTT